MPEPVLAVGLAATLDEEALVTTPEGLLSAVAAAAVESWRRAEDVAVTFAVRL